MAAVLLCPEISLGKGVDHFGVQTIVSDVTVSQAIDAIYTSIQNDNEELDLRIAELKAAMAREGTKEAVFETTRLAQPNRQGRKLMQSYFRKKGVAISFA